MSQGRRANSAPGRSYAWESRFERSWDAIREDATGRLASISGQVSSAEQSLGASPLARRPGGRLRRGLIRCLVICVDLSRAMATGVDLHPTRSLAVLGSLSKFLTEFFDQNPISQVSIVCTRDGGVKTITGMSSSVHAHIEALKSEIERHGCYGEASLQNCLESARRVLSRVPSYGTREILAVFGSLSTCDPGDVFVTISKLRAERVRCSVVGLGAEVFVFKEAALRTKGDYGVAMNEDHFQRLLEEQVTPPATEADNQNANALTCSMVRMGFPTLRVLRRDEPPRPTFNDLVPNRMGYDCPQCNAWLSEVPSECVLCGLTLVLSPHLARSYHHLFPVAPYEALDDQTAPKGQCFACRVSLGGERVMFRCTMCSEAFCRLCDVFVHESLHNCPGCESAGLRRSAAQDLR
eukprot:Plantae.Rhodophyta-Rhodochaete_pulchella.ctg522.p1 GENE.Plantae.Rhodophyta-Rhodochaete_pulchella.ctg522~~Plantae.Rhodophyta-Rhodochaete_pulchella.ctg522.p1  ORF type:complete len:409 (+),score=16.25 Plantae.Rhodophyta-Rhodochaete_pulchella.ctg522:237-1463(+)